MIATRTLEEARAAVVDELIRREYAAELARMNNAELRRWRSQLEAEERRAAFYVVRS